MTANFEKALKGETDSETLENIYNSYTELIDKLNYHMNNIDDQNMTEAYAGRKYLTEVDLSDQLDLKQNKLKVGEGLQLKKNKLTLVEQEKEETTTFESAFTEVESSNIVPHWASYFFKNGNYSFYYNKLGLGGASEVVVNCIFDKKLLDEPESNLNTSYNYEAFKLYVFIEGYSNTQSQQTGMDQSSAERCNILQIDLPKDTKEFNFSVDIQKIVFSIKDKEDETVCRGYFTDNKIDRITHVYVAKEMNYTASYEFYQFPKSTVRMWVR